MDQHKFQKLPEKLKNECSVEKKHKIAESTGKLLKI